MRRIVVLGSPGTKRSNYLRQAAVQAGLPVFFDTGICREVQQPQIKTTNEAEGLLFVDWKDWRKELIEGEVFLKIEPPLWKSSSLKELNILTGEYEKRLAELSFLKKEHGVTFFNDPEAIALLLDKRACKQKLMKAGLPVTEPLDGNSKVSERNTQQPDKNTEYYKKMPRLSAKNLPDFMMEKGVYQIFIKPVKGSGAAGVSAFRYQPATGRMALYTCAMICPGIGLVNTKRLRQFVRPEDVFPLLDRILELDCILERWYAKAEYQGFSYDLRVVMQEGEMDFALARLSKGPITNLHLNNRPLQIRDLRLPSSSMYAVRDICQNAMACFGGLRCAGIDILLEKGSLNPKIIEMNGQGDLIYQDIYHDNLIYRHQAEIMADWLRYAAAGPGTFDFTAKSVRKHVPGSNRENGK